MYKKGDKVYFKINGRPIRHEVMGYTEDGRLILVEKTDDFHRGLPFATSDYNVRDKP